MRLVPIVIALAGCAAPAALPPPKAAAPPAKSDENPPSLKEQMTAPRLAPAARRAAAERDRAIDRAAAVELAHRVAPTHGSGMTPVHVVVSDYYVEFDDSGCTQGVAHHLDVLLDGVVVRGIDLPCGQGLQAPAPRFEADELDVPPGVHRFRIREDATGVTDFRDFSFPLAKAPNYGVTLSVSAQAKSIHIEDPVAGAIDLT